MIYFTSDTHFSHEKILKLGNGRPFGSVTEMNEVLIKNWNSKVGPSDTVYHLGDFCWNQNSKQIKQLLGKLNGVKYLIYGNHDRLMPNEKSNSWMEIVPYKELHVNNRQIVLCHYPMAEWHGAFRGSIHLHGHVHGTFDYSQHNFPHHNHYIYDVGVDSNNYSPISLEEIFNKLGVKQSNVLCTGTYTK